MPPRETQIVRTETIIADICEKNQYGDLVVTDKAGNDHKIGNKRAVLFDQFIPGRATEVGYATYMNRDYIATAKLVDIGSQPVTRKTMPATKQTETPPESTTLAEEAVKLGATRIPTGDDRIRSMAISYAKDLVVAGKIELKDIKACADRFVAYILNIDRKE